MCNRVAALGVNFKMCGDTSFSNWASRCLKYHNEDPGTCAGLFCTSLQARNSWGKDTGLGFTSCSLLWSSVHAHIFDNPVLLLSQYDSASEGLRGMRTSGTRYIGKTLSASSQVSQSMQWYLRTAQPPGHGLDSSMCFLHGNLFLAKKIFSCVPTLLYHPPASQNYLCLIVE